MNQAELFSSIATHERAATVEVTAQRGYVDVVVTTESLMMSSIAAYQKFLRPKGRTDLWMVDLIKQTIDADSRIDWRNEYKVDAPRPHRTRRGVYTTTVWIRKR